MPVAGGGRCTRFAIQHGRERSVRLNQRGIPPHRERRVFVAALDEALARETERVRRLTHIAGPAQVAQESTVFELLSAGERRWHECSKA